MTNNKRLLNTYQNYHAHVYFERETLAYASSLCRQAGKKFGLKVGRMHQKTIGPHPKWSCQLTFTSKDFDELMPWLTENRDDLTIFVHPLTGDELKDHTDYAYWLGDSLELKLSIFTT